MASSRTNDRPVTRDDLESAFRNLEGDVKDQAAEARSTLATVAVAAAVVVVAVVYLFGRRSGRKKTTVVEIRRV